MERRVRRSDRRARAARSRRQRRGRTGLLVRVRVEKKNRAGRSVGIGTYGTEDSTARASAR